VAAGDGTEDLVVGGDTDEFVGNDTDDSVGNDTDEFVGGGTSAVDESAGNGRLNSTIPLPCANLMGRPE
jgi:hypothetical protein